MNKSDKQESFQIGFQLLQDRLSELKALNQNLLSDIDKTYIPLKQLQNNAIHIESFSDLSPKQAQDFLRKGLKLKQAQLFDLAISCFNDAINLDPNFSQAYYERGNTYFDQLQFEAAVASYNEAIRVDPHYIPAYLNKGIGLQNLGRLDLAVQDYQALTEIDPLHLQAYLNLAGVFNSLGQFELAIAAYDQAIISAPQDSRAYNSRGEIHKHLKQFAAAIQSFDRAIEINPNFALAHYNRGNTFFDLLEFDKAVSSYDRAIEADPIHAGAYMNRGIGLQNLARYAAAVQSYDKAIEINPEYVDAYLNRGNAFFSLKEYATAIQSYDDVIRFRPQDHLPYIKKADAYKELKQFELAHECINKAIDIKSDCAEAYCIQGHIYKEQKEFALSIASYNKAIELNPEYPFLYDIRLLAKLDISDWDDIENQIEVLRGRISKGERQASTFPPLASMDDPQIHKEVNELWSKHVYPEVEIYPPMQKYGPHEKIRVAFVSADFRNHPVSQLTINLFESFDKERFEITAFALGPESTDDITMRLKAAFDRFIWVDGLSDEEVAKLSRDLEIDIAVDLGGYTANCRTGIFARRAAPVQMTYLGYPSTTGAPYFDYLVSDETIIPEDSRKFYSEKIAYVPVYQVNDKKPISDKIFSRSEFGLPENSVVFCCFNNPYKITPDVFDIWTDILKSVDGSVLWFYEKYEITSINLRKEAIKRGIDPERLIFAKYMNSMEEHLARYALADLFLDTLPYNAHTTAGDALWAGLPVLTRLGNSFAARVAGGLLRAVGIPELVTSSIEEYRNLAIRLAKSPHELKAIRDKLAFKKLASPLFNAQEFSRNFEKTLVRIYERYQFDLPPDHIELS